MMRLIKILFFVFALFFNSFIAIAQTFTSYPNANITNNGQHCYNINVSGVGNINSIYELQSVCIDITHTWDADLDIYLVTPNGTTVELTTDNGWSGNNYSNTCFTLDALINVTSGSAPFSGNYSPEGNLNSVNNNQNADGIWQLCVTDDAAGDNGTLNSWALTFGTGCKWSMELVDTYGDGWNGGGHIDIIVNGVNTGSAYVYAGDGIIAGTNIRFDLDVNDGDNVQINFISGTWNSEDEYYIYDQNGNLIHSEGVGGTVPNSYNFTVSTCQKPLYTTGDCNGAIKVCSGTYSYANSAAGDGAYEEIAGRGSCYAGTILYGETLYPKGEVNSTWYIFEVQTGGNLEFSVNQNVSGDDYDWVLFDITNGSCQDIINGGLSSISCNWDVSTSATGMSSTTSGSGWESQIAVSAGDRYALVIDNWTTGGGGYTLNLNDGTAVIFDNISPQIDQVTNNHNDTIWFDFSEQVECSSVSTSDFTLTGPNNPYTILEVYSDECAAGSVMSQHWWLRISPSIVNNGNYTLTLSGDVNDQCSNPTSHNSDTFLPVELLDFKTECLNNNIIKLKWITVSEINNDYFTILKSADGVHYNFLTQVNGNGTTNNKNYYEIEDSLNNKSTYYKLTQTDYNGTTKIIKTIYANCYKFITNNYIIYPNPLMHGNKFKIIGLKKDDTVKIYDIYGREIKSQKLLKIGTYFININEAYNFKLIIY